MTPAEIAALAERLAAASYAYHNGLDPLMTDEEFDAGVDALRAAAPKHPFLMKVGAPVATGDEVALPVPLPSLNKIKPADGSLEKWLARNPAANYHISLKLDGVSALWFPGSEALYTRGDGMHGRDISIFAQFIQGLSRTPAAQGFAVRGELILRIDSPVVPAGKLARNIVAGALNRKVTEADAGLFREIRFVAYELVSPADKTPEEAFRLMRAAGFEVARSTLMPAAEVNAARLSEVFSAVESTSQYQIDGIVVAPNIARPPGWTPEVRKGAAVNPDDRVAWKTRLMATTARTTVRAVEWNISASGILIPRVLFDTVTLAGANIGAATGLHGRWIYDNGIGPGAVIEVRRAGDVIPQIIGVISPAPAGPAMPAEFVWDGVHIRPVAGTMETESALIQLTRGLAELGAENVGPGVVAKLYAAGFTTIGKIYAATAADFEARVESCGAKCAARIYEGLRVKQSTWTELTLLLASSTMPRGVAASKLKPLLELIPDPRYWSAATFKASRPAGLSPATIDAIVASVPAYLTWRAANPNIHPAVIAPKTISTNAATGSVATAPAIKMTVVFTGFRDRDLEAALEAAGHTVAPTVTKKTTHVVYPDGPKPTTGKAATAGERLISKSEFIALL